MLYVDSFRQKILSTTQAKVIYAHAHSVTSVFYLFAQSAFKRWFTGEMFASFIKNAVVLMLEQVAQLRQRDRATHAPAILRGAGHF